MNICLVVRRYCYINTSVFQFSFSISVQYSIIITAVDMQKLDDIKKTRYVLFHDEKLKKSERR